VRTALDTNVLLDVLGGDDAASSAATQTLSAAAVAGPLVICSVVHAELAASFEHQDEVEQFLGDLGVQLEAFSTDALWRGAQAWRAYARRRGWRIQCPSCGQQFALRCDACQRTVAWRQHIISDFLVGGHAVAQADRLMTRDLGYYRTYFPDLPLSSPGPSVPAS
jgi:predicted nucleic acid-binding protein